MKIYSAPIQGFTDCAWRNMHSAIFANGIDRYYAPFLRIERGAFRNKDLRDIDPKNNIGYHLVPQIIACPVEQFHALIEKVASLGYREIDINMGCPFPPIVKRHCGAGVLSSPDQVAAIMNVAKNFSDIRFSVKMRLGVEKRDEWCALMHSIESINPIHITLHPRTAIQQYSGEIDMEQFELLYSKAQFPLVYNGDIRSDHDIESISATYPQLQAIMIGRGLLANPALGMHMPDAKQKIIQLHDKLFEHYSKHLSGDAHLLAKMKSLWEYFLTETGDRKARKKILKSSTIEKYSTAVDSFWLTI